jgi:formiminoglutamase
VPTRETSLTPRSRTSTPQAVRSALDRYSTFDWTTATDLRAAVDVVDLGDVESPDGVDGLIRVASVAKSAEAGGMFAILGGDNATLYAAMTAVSGGRFHEWGLITFDAHHDLRDGWSNGSPVRQLLDDGLDGRHVVQLGIADFSNSPAYAARARDAGITVMTRTQLRTVPLSEAAARALEIAGAGGRRVYVDVDLDVVDRASVPGCPAAAPGGLSADQLREAVRAVCGDERVGAIDFTEVDVDRDAADERTVRLVALLLLEACVGLSQRLT